MNDSLEVVKLKIVQIKEKLINLFITGNVVEKVQIQYSKEMVSSLVTPNKIQEMINNNTVDNLAFETSKNGIGHIIELDNRYYRGRLPSKAF